eukprot:2163984-Rhodomonas_salina.4
MSREQVFEAVVPVDARGRSLLKQQVRSQMLNTARAMQSVLENGFDSAGFDASAHDIPSEV